jgi:hypothetical protein
MSPGCCQYCNDENKREQLEQHSLYLREVLCALKVPPKHPPLPPSPPPPQAENLIVKCCQYCNAENKRELLEQHSVFQRAALVALKALNKTRIMALSLNNGLWSFENNPPPSTVIGMSTSNTQKEE